MSEKRPFEKGERVACYIEGRRYIATVRDVLEYGNLRLDAAPPCPILYPVVHPRQVRRLVKRREFEISVRQDGTIMGVRLAGDAMDHTRNLGVFYRDNDVIRAREVRKP